MNPSYRRALAMSCIALSSTNVLAQGDEEVQEIVVWGTKVYASSVDLDRGAIEGRQADHVSDLLRVIPGVDVGGAHSLNQRVTIRSMDDKDLRITIDGANQNTYMYHHMGNLQIHADILESIDVGVGRNSVVNGGLGGHVRFVSKRAADLLRPGEALGARVQASHASNASSGYSVAAYGDPDGAFDFLAYYNAVARDNYEVGGGDIIDETGAVVPGTDGTVRGLEGDLSDALLKVGLQLSDTHRVEFGYEHYLDEGDYSYRPDMGLATDRAIADLLGVPLVYPTEFMRDTATLNYVGRVGDASELRATLFHNDSTLWRDERGLVFWNPGAATVNEGEATNSGINVLATTDLGAGGVGHGLTYGLEFIRYETEFVSDGARLSGEEATSLALYIEDRIDLDERFALIPGLRYERYDAETTVVDDAFSEVTGGLAAEWRPTDDFLLRLSGTQLFKGPEIGEVFTGAGFYDAPNPDIEAETGVNVELAGAYRRGPASFGATVFRTSIDGYIYDYASNPAGGSWKDNVGDLVLDGFEVYAGYDLGELGALLTFSRAESDLDAFDDYAQFDGARIDRQQGNTYSLMLDYEWADAGVAVHWESLLVDDVAAGPDLDGATLNNAKDGYTVHNASLTWTPARALEGMTLTLGIDNVFDAFYASQSSRTGVSFHPLFQELYLFDYEPGRNVKGTLAFRF